MYLFKHGSDHEAFSKEDVAFFSVRVVVDPVHLLAFMAAARCVLCFNLFHIWQPGESK